MRCEPYAASTPSRRILQRQMCAEWENTSHREIARVELEGIRWLDQRGYFAPGSLHAPGDARNEAHQRTYDCGAGTNVHGAAEFFVGHC